MAGATPERDVSLPLTGERTLPGIARENYWYRRHEAAYRFATGRCRGRDVLDAGCGEGYGTALLAGAARTALGVDRAAEVAAHADAAYPGVAFARADVCALPLAAGALDAVVSLQVVEHLGDGARHVAEAARVLRPGGWLLCGTPNRLTFSPGHGPVNPFHTVEFNASELEGLLLGHFDRVKVFGLFHGSRLAAAERERGCALPAAQLATDPAGWPPWLAGLVASVTVGDFEVRPGGGGLDASLDLLAVARAPRRP